MAKSADWIFDHIRKLNDLIWRGPQKSISRWQAFLLKQLRIIMLAARGFSRDKVQLRASALTFYSLLSVVPVAAIAFAIAKGFQLDNNLKELIIKKFSGEQEVLNWLINNATSALEKTRGGYIAGIGIIILFWSVMSLLQHIQSSFNHIWQITTSRPWYRKFTDYLTLMLIAPVFIILSGSVTVFVSTHLTEFISNAAILAFFKPIISALIKLIPYLLTWFTATILFIIMPNTKVKVVPAMVSGIITGTILQILQYVYIDLQFGISKLSAIYGSFAAVPLFIVWMQSSWIVVLLGAELAFANQNISRYELEFESLTISNYQKKILVLLIMRLIIRNFEKAEKPPSAEDVASNLKIPVRLAKGILSDLSCLKLVSVINDGSDMDQLYQPALDINKITVSYIFSRMEKNGNSHVTIGNNEDYLRVTSIMDKFGRLIEKSNQNILLKDL